MLLVLDYEFCHNIVKVPVDPGGDDLVDLQTTLTMLWQNLLSTGQMHKKPTSINHFSLYSDCTILHFCARFLFENLEKTLKGWIHGSYATHQNIYMYNVLLSWLKYSLTCFSLSSMPSQSQVIFFCSSSSLCLSCTCSISSSDVASVSSTSSSSVLSVASFRNSFGLGSFTNASKMGSTLNISWSPGSQKETQLSSWENFVQQLH